MKTQRLSLILNSNDRGGCILIGKMQKPSRVLLVVGFVLLLNSALDAQFPSVRIPSISFLSSHGFSSSLFSINLLFFAGSRPSGSAGERSTTPSKEQEHKLEFEEIVQSR